MTALTIEIHHRLNAPSGVVAQLLDRHDVIAERKFVDDDQHDQELLREANALAAEGDFQATMQLLFPDRSR